MYLLISVEKKQLKIAMPYYHPSQHFGDIAAYTVLGKKYGASTGIT